MLKLVLFLSMLGQTPDAIHFWPEAKAPTPVPVSPDAPTVLRAGETAIFDSNTELFYRVIPDGVVKVKKVNGPKSFLFTDASGEPQEKDFAGKFLLVITPVKSGQCQVVIVPKGVVSDKSIVVRLIEAQLGPKPPPPDPPVPPQPPTPVNPSPFADAGFRCLIVYETKDLAKMPTAQEQIIFSKEIRDYLNARCVAGPDGKTKEWRIYDQNIDTSQDSKVWQDTMKRERKSVPWLYVGDGKTGFEGPLPSDTSSTLALLKKFGGA